jgi:predicted nucleic acid-binding Zn ribbon protein
MDLGPMLREQLAVTAWPQIAGRLVAGHTRAEKVRDGVLLVTADTATWAHELRMRREELLTRLAGAVGEGVIGDIHFRTGSVRREREEVRPASIKLSRKETRAAATAAEHIADEELRAKAERAFLSLARMSRWRRETGWRRCGRCQQWQRTGKQWCSSCVSGGRGKGERGR